MVECAYVVFAEGHNRQGSCLFADQRFMNNYIYDISIYVENILQVSVEINFNFLSEHLARTGTKANERIKHRVLQYKGPVLESLSHL